MKDEIDFLPASKRQSFLQIDTIILGVWVARYARINQNNKYAISLQYLKKAMSDEVEFFKQIRIKVSHKLILWFWWGWQNILNVFKIASLQCLYNISKKEVRNEANFFHAEKHQSFLQDDFNTLGIKLPSRWYYHCWWEWSSILNNIFTIYQKRSKGWSSFFACI